MISYNQGFWILTYVSKTFLCVKELLAPYRYLLQIPGKEIRIQLAKVSFVAE